MIGAMIDRISIRTGDWVALLVLPAIAITIYEVFLRYVLNWPTLWVHPLTTALTATTYVMAGSYVLQRGDFIRVTFLYDKMEPRPRLFARVISDVMTVFWGVVIVYGSAKEAYESVFKFVGGKWRPETTGDAWDVPIPAVMRTIIFISFSLFLVQSVLELVRSVACTFRKEGGQ
jgi:TRAP-type mannitol/chloroaromatic compound transport system permease small subunit